MQPGYFGDAGGSEQYSSNLQHNALAQRIVGAQLGQQTTKIAPTVGRVVWFYPAADTQTADFSPPASGQPLAAIVAAVKAPDSVNLTVFDAMGFPHARINVLLLQEGQDAPEGGFYATWMPYQIGQAKKEADRAQDAKNMAISASRDYEVEARRAQAVEMALRTPGLAGQQDVIDAASAYLEFIKKGGLGL